MICKKKHPHPKGLDLYEVHQGTLKVFLKLGRAKEIEKRGYCSFLSGVLERYPQNNIDRIVVKICPPKSRKCPGPSLTFGVTAETGQVVKC